MDLAKAVEDNEARFLLELGRAGGGEERDDEDVHWIIGGSPIGYHNAVVRCSVDAAHADEIIVASREVMRRYGVAGSWHVGPSMEPADLGTRLTMLGFDGGPEPGMAIELASMASVDAVSGLAIERVDELDGYERVLAGGFGEGPPEAAWVCEMYRRIGLDHDTWRHFVGFLDGDAVATATTFFAADVVGLYFVCTSPSVRGRGIGAAISRFALADAVGVVSHGVLGSSPMGHRVYERLGFQTVCYVHVHEWGPD